MGLYYIILIVPFNYVCMSYEYIHGNFVHAAVFQLCQRGLVTSLARVGHGSQLVTLYTHSDFYLINTIDLINMIENCNRPTL